MFALFNWLFFPLLVFAFAVSLGSWYWRRLGVSHSLLWRGRSPGAPASLSASRSVPTFRGKPAAQALLVLLALPVQWALAGVNWLLDLL